ncbi:GNAT family N-acetyltransferase [Microbulbifer sp. GL-2]|uniref:GNAT family N-acetyltransferase n=1 Tax=Microbulbifer sp. GL-2 TaxID=2591606 RepID=UPI0011628385|nr:GNAT family N-acetyltransferase [Microbulbifer sp. GL-2]BBM03020.1 hypothetical protein GL2_30940 [Microbulbifer sp. GL-2]
MNKVTYMSFNKVDSEGLLAVLNQDELRTHLVKHAYFDAASLETWMEEKITVDSLPGCRVRAVYIDDTLAGWCGIQPDDNGHELAIVISKKFWGNGPAIFKVLMSWAKDLGHKEILFHLLDSRPEYNALNKIATKVHKTELLGRCFSTYCIAVNGEKRNIGHQFNG